MFFNRNTTSKKVKMDPVDEELLKKDVFSADEALEMGRQARIQKRNNNRRSIFQNVKYAIQSGVTSSIMNTNLFDDGNDIYFEGLGYKVEIIWYDSTNQLRVGKPTDDDMITGQHWNNNGQLQPFNYKPQTQIRVRWEK